MAIYTQDIRKELYAQLELSQYELEEAQEAQEFWAGQPQDKEVEYEDDVGLVRSTAAKQLETYSLDVIPSAAQKVEIYRYLLSRFAETDTQKGVSSGAPEYKQTL